MAYEGTKIAVSRLPLATAAIAGAVVVGTNLTVTTGTVSLTAANVNAALGAAGLGDAQLSANVPLKNAANIFVTNMQTFSVATLFNGAVALPAASLTSALHVTGGGGSPNGVKLYWGDGSGWTMTFNTRAASVDTIRHTFLDTGAYTSTGRITAGNGFTVSAGTVVLPAASIADAALSANVGLLTGTQTLTGLKNFSGGVTLTAGALTLFADPTLALHAATKQYVDAIASGLGTKASVRVATAAALPTYTRSVNVITASAVGILTVDGVATVLNDRILLKDGAAGADNGIYSVTTAGTAGVAYVLTRSTDADNTPANEVTAGMYCFVEEGTVNADTGWVLATNNPITLNTTSLSFTQFSSAGIVTAGNGLTKTGNVISALADPTGPTISVAAAGISVLTNSLLVSHIASTAKATVATVSTLMLRDAAGRSQVVDPLTGPDVANKTYVDSRTLGLPITGEVPTGTKNGSNVTFTLAHSPIAATFQLFQNGIMLTVTTHYTLSGATITYVSGFQPASTEPHITNYSY